MGGNVKSSALITLPLGWQLHRLYIISHSLVTLKWFHSGPTRTVFKIRRWNLWLFSKLNGKLPTLAMGPWLCISLTEQIYVIDPGAFQLWALLLKPQLWSHNHRTSIEKGQDRACGPSPSRVQVGVLPPACTPPLWIHPISSPCSPLCVLGELNKLCDSSISIWSVHLPVLWPLE